MPPPALINSPWELLVLAWLAALGGSVGSFVNVVVYRWPRGMSLLWPGSRCPACGRPIRWHDNVPVLAWLWLGGRCRDCRTAISPRYPLVELATAVAFLLLGWADVAGGASVAAVAEPQRLTAAAAGRFIYHALAVTGLATLGLIALDGQPIPRRLGLGLAVAGLAGATLLGAAHDAFVFSSTSPAPGTALAAPMEAAQAGGRAAALAALVASAGGAVAGLCLAAAWRAGHRIWPPANRSSHGVTLVFMVCGSFLGGRAAPSLLVMAAAALVGLALVRRRRRAGPPDAEAAAGLVAAGLVIAVVVLAAAGQGWASDILAGRWTGSLVGFGAAGCAVLACGLTVRGLARRA